MMILLLQFIATGDNLQLNTSTENLLFTDTVTNSFWLNKNAEELRGRNEKIWSTNKKSSKLSSTQV